MPGIRLAVLLLILCSMSWAADPDSLVRGEQGAKLDRHLRRLAGFGFSGVTLVARGGEVILARGYGLADREKNIPMRATTVINTGSITKQFTAAAILRLEALGRLRTEDSIARHLPGVPEDKQGITLHHLLTHTAGLRSDYGPTDYEQVTREQYLKRVFSAPLESPPGQRFEYSNAGYSLLAATIEIISGRSYEEFLRGELFAPSGMNDTGYFTGADIPERIAQGYREGELWGTVPGHIRQGGRLSWNLLGNGGIQSTVWDLYRWHQALAGGRILTAAAHEKLQTPYIEEGPGAGTHYAYGWSVARTPHGRLIEHNGGNGIFAADFLRYVDANAVVIIASNAAEYSAIAVSHTLGRLALGEEVAEPPATIGLDHSKLQALAGDYRLRGGGLLTVSATEQGLRVEAHGRDAFEALYSAAEDPNPLRRAELTERTRKIIEANARGDYALLKEAFGAGMDAAEIERMENEVWSGFRQRLGQFRSVEIIGTVPAREGLVQTYAELHFDQGVRLLRYAWGPRGLRGIRILERLQPLEFLPTSETEFARFDFATQQASHIRIQGGKLTAGPPAAPVVLEKLPPAPGA